MSDRLKMDIPIEMRERSQYWDKYLDEHGQYPASSATE
jgi:hypothetical protein